VCKERGQTDKVTAVEWIEEELYRVTQNKIHHQTMCNIFATGGQILKILQAV